MANETPTLKVLVIDDDAQNLDLIGDALKQEGLEIAQALGPRLGLEKFSTLRPRVVLLDLIMPEMGGMEVLERIIAADPGVDVILMTAHYSAESAVEAIQKGAADYLTKPLNIEKLRDRFKTLLTDAQTRVNTLKLDNQLVGAYQFEGIVGRSPLMLDVFAKIRRVSPHFRTVLVTGATGTGKELIARSLHRLSPVPVDPLSSAIVQHWLRH